MHWIETGKLYSLRSLSLCGLPVRRLKNSSQRWSTRNGRYALQIIPLGEQGVPYGQDRLVLLLFSTLVREQGSENIQVDSLAEILRGLGLGSDGRTYGRFQLRLQRVLESTFVFYVHPASGPRRRTILRLADTEDSWDLTGQGFRIRLSPSYRRWVEREAFPISLDVVRHLGSSPVNLDFYLWLVLYSRACRRGRKFRIPLQGAGGLRSQLRVEGYTQIRDFRIKVRQWLHRIREVWPECPATLTENQQALVIYHADP